MKFHPDRNQGDESAAEKFKEVKVAYEILTDSQKKAAYDQYGHAAFEQGVLEFHKQMFSIERELFSDFITSQFLKTLPNDFPRILEAAKSKSPVSNSGVAA